MRVGQARKRDANEQAIVAALQKVGVIVIRISAAGIPDLLCYHTRTGFFLLEVKSRTGRLTPAQRTTTAAIPFHVARTEGEALDIFETEVRKYR